MSKPIDEPRLSRLEVNLNQETAEAFKRLKSRTGSHTETVRCAMALFDFIAGERLKGRVVQIMDADGKNVNELHLLDLGPAS